MKLNKIMTFFYIGLPICMILRMIQIAFTIDFESGFYKEGYIEYSNGILFVIVLFCAALMFFCYKAFEAPKNIPNGNFLLATGSTILSASLVYEVYKEVLPNIIFNWQNFLIKGFGILAAVYFILIAFQCGLKIKIHPMLHIVPVIYLIIKTVFTFINISSLAIISDNIFIMAAYCVTLLFFVNYLKLYNDIDDECNFRKILATGLCSSVICLTQSVSYFTVNFISDIQYTHTDSITNLTLLGLGCFSLFFVISHFSIQKSYNRRYK